MAWNSGATQLRRNAAPLAMVDGVLANKLRLTPSMTGKPAKARELREYTVLGIFYP